MLASAASGSLRSPSVGAGLGKLRHSSDLGPHPSPWQISPSSLPLWGLMAQNNKFPVYVIFRYSMGIICPLHWLSFLKCPSPPTKCFSYMPPHVHVSSIAGENFPCECLLTPRRSHWTRVRLVFCHGMFCSVSGFRRRAGLTSVPLAKRETLWKWSYRWLDWAYGMAVSHLEGILITVRPINEVGLSAN